MCKGRVYPGSAGLGLTFNSYSVVNCSLPDLDVHVLTIAPDKRGYPDFLFLISARKTYVVDASNEYSKCPKISNTLFHTFLD